MEVAGYAADAKVLKSEHVLVGRQEGYSFFHEAFFDYADRHAPTPQPGPATPGAAPC